MKIKTSLGEKIFQVFNYTFLALLSIICIYPLWHVLMASFSDHYALLGHSSLLLWFKDFTLDAYNKVLANPRIITGYISSIKLLVLGVSWQMIMTILCAYVLSRPRFLLRRPLMLMITFTMFFSGGTIPFYMNLRDLGMLGHIWGLIIPFSMTTYNMIILRTAMEGLPDGLIEAATIDGAGHITIMFRIVLPLVKATLAVLVLYYGVAHWNNWFWAVRVISDSSQLPLAVILRDILIESNTAIMDGGQVSAENIKYATIIVSTLPILSIYPFIQRYFTQGVMIGAVKG